MSEEEKESIDKVANFFENNVGKILLGVVIAWIISFVAVVCWFQPVDSDGVFDIGRFGDAFGSINALFSGLAFLGVIVAIILQRKELKLQREELEMTRGVLEDQKEQMGRQAESLEKQNFENTFFNMLSLHNEIASNLQGRNSAKEEILGKEVFNAFHNNMEWDLNILGVSSDSEEFSDFCTDFFSYRANEYGSYFQNLFVIMQWLGSHKLSDTDMYVDILKAQLSSQELLTIFYYCLSDMGMDTLMLFVDESALLEGLRDVDLLDPTHNDLFKVQHTEKINDHT